MRGTSVEELLDLGDRSRQGEDDDVVTGQNLVVTPRDDDVISSNDRPDHGVLGEVDLLQGFSRDHGVLVHREFNGLGVRARQSADRHDSSAPHIPQDGVDGRHSRRD